MTTKGKRRSDREQEITKDKRIVDTREKWNEGVTLKVSVAKGVFFSSSDSSD